MFMMMMMMTMIHVNTEAIIIKLKRT